ncbi:hypothetical protein MTR_1g028120 [Medicago truncatula]|uniref:Uncharacterized protein n=1 Tax=Medicago truncatula TaxID=3880 RepID=A0A072VG51_MEDTR|nr:hypothetical protein MTR_1g028120 [Medicago truncatula]
MDQSLGNYEYRKKSKKDEQSANIITRTSNRIDVRIRVKSQVYFPSWVYDQFSEGKEIEMGNGDVESLEMPPKPFQTPKGMPVQGIGQLRNLP